MLVNRFPFGDAVSRIGRRSFLRRREFLGLVGGVAAWPRVGRAVQSLPIVGFLHYGPQTFAGPQVSAFWQALNQAGLVENRDVVVTYRWGEQHRERLPALALDLCRRESRSSSLAALRLPWRQGRRPKRSLSSSLPRQSLLATVLIWSIPTGTSRGSAWLLQTCWRSDFKHCSSLPQL